MRNKTLNYVDFAKFVHGCLKLQIRTQKRFIKMKSTSPMLIVRVLHTYGQKKLAHMNITNISYFKYKSLKKLRLKIYIGNSLKKENNIRIL